MESLEGVRLRIAELIATLLGNLGQMNEDRVKDFLG